MTARWIERDGVPVVADHGDVAAEIRRVRRSVGIARLPNVTAFRLRGQAGFDALDAVLPCDLFLRDGQLRQTVLLDDDGHVVADVLVGSDDEDVLLFAEGLPADRIAARLGHPCEDLREHLALIVLTGPFAWELMAAWDTPGVIGLPYLAFYRPRSGGLVSRAGKSGEYGYELWVPADGADAEQARLLELGARLDAGLVGTEALDHCALENWFFNPHAEGRAGLDPVELQLQWRISRHKDAPGLAALAAKGWRPGRRVTAIRTERPVSAGDGVLLDGEPIGTVLVARPDPRGAGSVAIGLLDVAVAHSGLPIATAQGVPGRTVSPPFVDNWSLFVKPQRHTWADRASIGLPGA